MPCHGGLRAPELDGCRLQRSRGASSVWMLPLCNSSWIYRPRARENMLLTAILHPRARFVSKSSC